MTIMTPCSVLCLSIERPRGEFYPIYSPIQNELTSVGIHDSSANQFP